MLPAPKPTPDNDHVTARLKDLRQRSGLSMDALAQRLGYKGGSSYQRYESADQIKKDYLPFDFVLKLAVALADTGAPPISREEVLSLSQYSTEDIERYLAEGATSHIGNTPDLPPEAEEINPLLTPGSDPIREINLRAAAGAGSLEEPEMGPLWHFPHEWIAAEFRAKAPQLKIITIDGDSMVSDPPSRRDLEPGDKVIVNTADTTPSPPGVFIIYDGLGLVAKRVEPVPDSDPITVKITSHNSKHEPYRRTLDEAHIWGRVVGRWQRF